MTSGEKFIQDIEQQRQHNQLTLDAAIQKCRDYIVAPGSDAERAKVRKYRQTLESEKSGTGPATVKVGQSAAAVAGDLALVEQDILARDWDAALDKLEPIISAEPGNDQALDLLEQVADKGIARAKPRAIEILDGIDPANRSPHVEALLQRLSSPSAVPPSKGQAPPQSQVSQSANPALAGGAAASATASAASTPTAPQMPAGSTSGSTPSSPPQPSMPPLPPTPAGPPIDSEEAYAQARLAMANGEWELARRLVYQIDPNHPRHQAVDDLLLAIEEGAVYDRLPKLKPLPGRLSSAKNRRNWTEVEQVWQQVETEIDSWRAANPGQRIDIPKSLLAVYTLSRHQQDAEIRLKEAIPLRENAQFAKAEAILEEAKGLDPTNGVILDEITKCKTGAANRKFVFGIKRGSAPAVDELVEAREKCEELVEIAPNSQDVADLDAWLVRAINDRVKQLKQRVDDRVAAVGRDKMLDDKLRDANQAEQAVNGIERLSPSDADLPDKRREVEELKDRLETAKRSRDDVELKLDPYFQGQAMLTPTLASGFLRDLQVVAGEAPEDARLGALSTKFADGVVRAIQQNVKFPGRVSVSDIQQAEEMTSLVAQAPAQPRTQSVDGLQQEIVRQAMAAVTERLKFGANDPSATIQVQLQEAGEIATCIPSLRAAGQFPGVAALPGQIQMAADRAVRSRLDFIRPPTPGGPPAPIPTDEAKARLAEATVLADTAMDLPRDAGPNQPELLRGVILTAGVDAVLKRLELGEKTYVTLTEAEDLAAAVRQLPEAQGSPDVDRMDKGLQAFRRRLGRGATIKTMAGWRIPILVTVGILAACGVLWMALNPPALIRAAQDQIAMLLTPTLTPAPTGTPVPTTTPVPTIAPTATPGVSIGPAAQITLSGTDCEYIEQHNVCNEPRDGPAFKNYYRANRDLLGVPISDILNENGRDVQYFQYGRLEHHPANRGTTYEYEMGLLGQELAKVLAERGQKALAAAMAPVAPDSAKGQYFPDTNHHVSTANGFLRYFTDQGSLDVFGFPVSEEFQEGDTVRQYFQRHVLVKKSGQEIQRAWVGFDYLQYVRNARICHNLRKVNCGP